MVNEVDYNSPRSIQALLDNYQLTPKKRYGQNFLVNPSARAKIVNALEIEGGEKVWEVGPGIGSLTKSLVELPIDLTVFEIDRGFARILEERYGRYANFRIITGDFINTWNDERKSRGTPDLILGNLPYSSAAAIVLSLFEGCIQASKLVFTVQREMADRMTAKPGTPQYSSFTALCAIMWDVRSLGDLKAGSFYPIPRVRSTVVELLPSGRVSDVPTVLLLRTARELFAGRRKTIKNNIRLMAAKYGVAPNLLLSAATGIGIDVQRRPGTMPPTVIHDLICALSDHLPEANTRRDM